MIVALAKTERITLGVDENDDTRAFVAGMRRLGVTAHVAQHSKGLPCPTVE
jgi:hypothetical protein